MSQRRADKGTPGTKALELRNEPQPIKRKTRREQQSHTKDQGKEEKQKGDCGGKGSGTEGGCPAWVGGVRQPGAEAPRTSSGPASLAPVPRAPLVGSQVLCAQGG